MATSYTPNYNLDLYESKDKPNLRDQYNSAMGKIDAQMKKSADDVVNANANVLTLQTQMTEAQKTISDVKTTADTALAQSNTNKTDIAATNSNVDSLATRLTTVEGVSDKNKSDIAAVSAGLEAAQADISTAQGDIETLTSSLAGKAPTNHASSSTVYGKAAPDTFGHVKVTDAIGDANADTGTASSPKGVQEAIREWLIPSIVQMPTPSSGTYREGMSVCMVYRKWKNLKFVFSLQLPGTGNEDYIKVCNCSDLGIPNPSEERTIRDSVSSYVSGSNAATFNTNMYVHTNGDIMLDGWNNVHGSRVDWEIETPMQVLIDYSTW